MKWIGIGMNMDIINVLREEEIFPEDVIRELDREALMSKARIVKYYKNENIIRIGDEPIYTYFLADGVVRGYVQKTNGQEVTDSLTYKKGCAIHPLSDLGYSSPINYQALETTRLVMFRQDDLWDCIYKSKVLMKATIKQLNEMLSRHRRAKAARYIYLSRQRFEWFCEEYEPLIGRISNRVIASFLDITPETLSRIQNTKEPEQEEE